jgi:hypothetical protein
MLKVNTNSSSLQLTVLEEITFCVLRGFTLKFLTLHRGEMLKVNTNSSSLQLAVLEEITFWVLRSSVIQVR